MAHKWVHWLHNPCHLGSPLRFRASEQGRKSARAHKGADWQNNPCCLVGPLRFTMGLGGISSGPQVGGLAT